MTGMLYIIGKARVLHCLFYHAVHPVDVTHRSMKKQMVNRTVCVFLGMWEPRFAISLWQLTELFLKMCLIFMWQVKVPVLWGKTLEFVAKTGIKCVCVHCVSLALVWNNIASPGIYFVEHKRIKAVTHVRAAAVKTGLLAPPGNFFLMMNYNNMIV